MFSNTANSSASDKVNTRPRLKAIFCFIGERQQEIALTVGYILVAGLFFGLGKYSVTSQVPEIKIQEPAVDLSQVYNNLENLATGLHGTVAGTATTTDDLDCTGKIKGNISSSSKIYHVPGGAFYKRTVPEMCFDTAAQAQAAGFRKSQR